MGNGARAQQKRERAGNKDKKEPASQLKSVSSNLIDPFSVSSCSSLFFHLFTSFSAFAILGYLFLVLQTTFFHQHPADFLGSVFICLSNSG
jgi:hypothetical protein